MVFIIRKRILILLALILLALGSFIVYSCLFRGYLYLWEIKSNGKTLYLLGTIHAFKQELYEKIDQKIIDAFNKSDILLTESSDSRSKRWMLPLGDSLSNYITEEYYQKLDELFKEHELFIDAYSPYRPYYFINRMIEISGSIYGWDEYYRGGIDIFFINKYYYKNIHHNWSKYALEKQDYFAVYLEENLSREELGYHIYHLARRYIEEGLFIKESCESMMKAWLNGSVDEWLDEYYIANITRLDSDPEVNKDLELIISIKLDLIHEKRNLYMVDTVEEFLQGDEYDIIFAMAGALHFTGENNIIEILEKKGYKAKRIKKSLTLPF